MSISLFKHIIISLILLSGLLGYAGFAYPASGPTDKELKSLPPFCKPRLRSTSPAEVARWKGVFGYKAWAKLHHYCQQLNLINRANRTRNSEARRDLLITAYKGLHRFSKEIRTTFILRHEVYYHIGKVAKRLDKYGEAISAYRKAIDIKPDYTRAYAALSDIYMKNGLLEEAANTIKNGLAKKPKSKSLKKRQKKLMKLMQERGDKDSKADEKQAGTGE